MQLQAFSISRLFDQYDHKISFPIKGEGDPTPSLVILHGPNGIGKTTILRMIDGILKLDFNPFRSVPFTKACLSFSDGKSIIVRAIKNNSAQLKYLRVEFLGDAIDLAPRRSGPLREADSSKTEKFRQRFFIYASPITFDLINTQRFRDEIIEDETEPEDPQLELWEESYQLKMARGKNPELLRRKIRPKRYLAGRVKKFIGEAQVDFSHFFATTEPDLFTKIIDGIVGVGTYNFEPKELLARLLAVERRDKVAERFGLAVEKWDRQRITKTLKTLKQDVMGKQALAVISAYVEFLESRSSERALITERLTTFEDTVKDFIQNKQIRIDPIMGIVINIGRGKRLNEQQLSSGEYHLLYLLVSAMVTKRRGTVIAIDEPEMSMHIAWQRNLVAAILKCASMAHPQLLLATHSPDIAAQYPQSMCELGR